MLCEACEHDRFPDCSRKSLKKKKAQSTASRQLTASVSAGRSESSDDTAATSVGVSLLVGLFSARKMMDVVTTRLHL